MAINISHVIRVEDGLSLQWQYKYHEQSKHKMATNGGRYYPKEFVLCYILIQMYKYVLIKILK